MKPRRKKSSDRVILHMETNGPGGYYFARFRRFSGPTAVGVFRLSPADVLPRLYLAILVKKGYESQVRVEMSGTLSRDEQDVADDVAAEAVRLIRDTEWVKMTEDWSPSDFAWRGPKKEPLVTRKKSLRGRTKS